jgi:hypothetical protein
MRKILLVAALLVLVGAPAYADSFTNGGFETGDTTGWTIGAGTWSGHLGVFPQVPADYLPGGIYYNMGYYRGAVVTPGPDPIVGAALNQVYNGNYAYRANDWIDNYDYSVGVISQTVANYSDNDIYFEWAAVLESSHGATDSDYFALTLRDVTAGVDLVSRSYSSYSAAGIFHQSGYWYYTDWQVEHIDLAALGAVGHTLTLSLLASDCAWGGHAGYVYLDGFAPVIIPPSDVPEPTSMILLGSGLVGLAARVRRSRKK